MTKTRTPKINFSVSEKIMRSYSLRFGPDRPHPYGIASFCGSVVHKQIAEIGKYRCVIISLDFRVFSGYAPSNSESQLEVSCVGRAYPVARGCDPGDIVIFPYCNFMVGKGKPLTGWLTDTIVDVTALAESRWSDPVAQQKMEELFNNIKKDGLW